MQLTRTMRRTANFKVVAEVAKKMGRDVPVSIRVNPEIDAKTHPYITTGLRKNKFGVLWPEARRLYRDIKETEHLVPVGISSHIGSQIVEIPPFVAAIRSVRQMVSELAASGIRIEIHRYRRGFGHYVQERATTPSRRIREGHRDRARRHRAHARYSSRAGS